MSSCGSRCDTSALCAPVLYIRSDLIILMFDVATLDLCEEMSNVLAALAPHAHKLRIVLNKAQQASTDDLLKVKRGIIIP